MSIVNQSKSILLLSVKENRNILLVLLLSISVLAFSSFSLPKPKEDVKVEKTGTKQEQKKQIKSVEFEALVSVASFVIPVQFADVFVQSFDIELNEWIESYFEPKSQEFFRIFFTHIISKNAP